MPTMTHTPGRRHSLTGQANKENFGVYFVPSPFGNTSMVALRDLSNGKNVQRGERTPTTTRRQTLGTMSFNERSPAARNSRRFSDDFAGSNDNTPLSHALFRTRLKEDSLSSSRMGDVTLDRMLDAIIESARKEVATQDKKHVTPEVKKEDFEASIHEMEVRTPTHLKRQRVVRRKNAAKTTEKKAQASSEVENQEPQAYIGLTLPNGIPSPDTPLFKNQHSDRFQQSMGMNTPRHLAFVVDSDYAHKKDQQRCSTPTLEETQSIKRCLSFSSGSEDDDADYSAAKRSSVASSNASSTNGEYFYSARSSGSSQNSRSMKSAAIKGVLDLTASVTDNKLNVHVIRCRELERANGSTALNAYVKVALIRKSLTGGAAQPNDHGFQRTAVHRHSSRPFFDHRFKFDLSKSAAADKFFENSNSSEDLYGNEDRLQLAVWHRDRQLKRSEFLGCMSFSVNTLRQQPINGTYKLQSQACLNNPQPAVQLPAATAPTHTHTHPQPQPATAPSQHPFNTDAPSMTTVTRQKSNDEDGMSIDSMAQACDQPMVLSKKAIHQRDADENLFLRFLELDPLPDETTPAKGATNNTTTTTTNNNINNNTSGGSNCGSQRRLSAAGKPIGRTPFTMTKKLVRTTERGFGFSIVWTHPPRVEKIEPGLSADRIGIMPGDYVIFVDKHNVVTMPEADVLNLIRSQGSTLTLEIFRRSGSGGAMAPPPTQTMSVTGRSNATTAVMNGRTSAPSRVASVTSNYASDEIQSTATTTAPIGAVTATPAPRRASVLPGANAANMQARPSTACSGATTSSIEAAKRRLNLPQVTFSKESIAPITDNRRRFLMQLISREQNFISALHFGMQRFVQPLLERKDLISPNDHRTLFQNIDELLRISEDILEQLCNDDAEPQMNFASRVYLSKTTTICAAYKKYCNGIKRADCVLVNKSRQTGSEFVSFITEPQVPRKRPDLTMFIHRPLQHFREILKLMQLLASNCHVDTEEHKNFSSVINELQAAYREITVTSGLMEPLGEGRPLLTLQDLESRMVFTKCKPFTLAVQGRQWIFGGDLSRVEGRSVKPYWTLLFSDIIVFAKVSRDRVLFITEEPIPIANIVDSCFHMRKKTAEFRITVDPNGRLAESPTGYCAPDLTRTPKKGGRRKSLVLRAPSLELKAVWQNLLQRQIFLVNAALGSTPLSSPLDSPDVLNTLVPLSDIGIASASIGSIKLSSLDSINLKNQQQSNRLKNSTDQIDMLIDEKCRILNKTGTSKSNAIHLANWMKGQLDKQQEQARLAAQRSRENLSKEDEHLLYPESDQDERITYWTRQQLEKRTKELNLAKENGNMLAKPNFGGKRLSGVEEVSMSEHSEAVSVISQSHSTTSDSQITVRSSPIVLDKLAVCRHCHKNCQQSSNGNNNARPSSASAAALICNSLKVQHSQASPNRCCRLNGTASLAGSTSSISSSTITGEPPSERSSKVVPSSSKRETGDTESDVAQLITDDLSQSEATDDSVGAIPSSSSGRTEARRSHQRLTTSISKLRILDSQTVEETQHLMNGHCSGGSSGGESDKKSTSTHKPKPAPPPRKLKISPQTIEELPKIAADQQVKATVTITETAKVVRIHEATTPTKSPRSIKATTPTTTKSTKSPHTPQTPQTPHTPHSPFSTQFIACNCECNPADFAHTTLSPDELEQQTCKLIESPKQSPKMPRSQPNFNQVPPADPHQYCKCVCGGKDRDKYQTVRTDAEDDDLSLMLIGLAQFTPAAKLLNVKTTPTAPAPTPTTTLEAHDVPTIAVVPPTPEAILTKTTTNVWDNSNSVAAHATTSKLHINNVQPRQAVIENIPEDSCDDSPLDEEPPYRPMSAALRRYGTMSSLEKLPSDERLEDDELDELDDDEADMADDADDDDNPHMTVQRDDDEDDYDEIDDKARADNVEIGNDEDVQIITKAVYDSEATCSSNGSAWTSRAGSYVSGKMSFFEESRAFIDRYLGRWNQEQTHPAASETEEQMDECTSGATSGEEVWGTPTSGGDNDDMHMGNSENTHSSPTKSSNSLNDDDDTELMMDELLMAPPMTASTIRGLLPRRRLEPLFEEETESDEEKTQQESEELKKGETKTNGRYLEDSAGSSSDEDYSETAGIANPALEEEDDPHSLEERLQPHLQTSTMGPRPLRNPGATASILPEAVLRGSSCEYLLEPRGSTVTSSCSSSSNVAICSTKAGQRQHVTLVETQATLTTNTSATTMTMRTQTCVTNQARSTTTTIISKENVTTSSKEKDFSSSSSRTAKVQPAKFTPPPPPPRRLVLTQTDLKANAAPSAKATPPPRKYGVSADVGSSAAAADTASSTDAKGPLPRHPAASNIRNSTDSTAGGGKRRSSTTIIETSLLGPADRNPHASTSSTIASTTTMNQQGAGITKSAEGSPSSRAGCGLSPRLEMRLALNHDILGDEDLICYAPGPDLTTILGHDLSTFHRLTGRDLLNRSANHRVQPREAVISFSQQRNSKMDTPTVNRRPRPRPSITSSSGSSSQTTHTGKAALGGGSARVGGVPQHLQPNRNTWSNSVSAAPSDDESVKNDDSSRSYSCSTDANRLGDLEILAKREKIYSMSQLKSGSPARKTTTTKATSTLQATEYIALKQTGFSRNLPATTTSMMDAQTEGDSESTESSMSGGVRARVRKIGRDETALMEAGKGNRLINFLKRRNSEVPLSPNCSELSLNELPTGGTASQKPAQMSPRKDNDKPSLNRRLWKQIIKRRRASSVSELVAS